jgi:FkbM family methyltransferase
MHGGVLQTSGREVATKIFNDFIMYLDPRDIAITPHIVLEGIWEKWVTLAWLSILQKQDAIVFDIGANNGYYGMLAAKELDNKKGKVVLFEPNPNLLPYIHKTLSVNWLNENTIVEPLAVSDSNGTAQLNVLKDYTGSSSMHSLEYLDSYLSHKMQVEAEEVVEVRTVTIDSYCKSHNIDHVDIAIIDIEGYEEKAYQGMGKTIAASPDMIFFIEFTKNGYEHPKRFYDQMTKDFGNVYTLNTEGDFISPKDTSYESVLGSVEEYIMLVFSKHRLHKNGK